MFVQKMLELGFTIVVMYIDDMNLIRTLEELTKVFEYLKDNLKCGSRENKILSQLVD